MNKKQNRYKLGIFKGFMLCFQIITTFPVRKQTTGINTPERS